MDNIYIRDLSLSCIIGVNDWERRTKQTLNINLDLETDIHEAGKHDDINLTVDYEKIRDQIEKIVTHSQFYLIEALAEEIAVQCLAESRVESVRVRIEKPGALRNTRTVGVEIYRNCKGTKQKKES